VSAEAFLLPDHLEFRGIDHHQRQPAAQPAGRGDHGDPVAVPAREAAGAHVPYAVFGLDRAEQLALRRKDVKLLLDAAGQDQGGGVGPAGHGDLEDRRGPPERPEQPSVVLQGEHGTARRRNERLIAPIAVDVRNA